MKNDISSSEDIHLLVDTFYEKAKNDPVIGFVFNDVMKVNWEDHLPKMYGFWEILLLGKMGVQSNPMQKHLMINTKVRLTEEHFDRWVKLWFETLDELFTGPTTNLAKERAKAIRQTLWQRIKLSESNQIS